MALRDGSLEDYEGAAIRHYLDATALKDTGRFDNAGHLIGFAAECAIKHRINVASGPAPSPALHLPDILPAARKRLGERKSYASMYTLLRADIFAGWSVDHRYASTGKITEQQLENWIATTKRLFAAANIRVRVS